MEFIYKSAEVYIPDGADEPAALGRTTQMGVCAHQDDLEILSFPGILECYGSPTDWFGGVCVTNGAGSPRKDLYAAYTDDEMMAVRRVEQKKAAMIGDYSFMALLDFTSADVKCDKKPEVAADLKGLFAAARPTRVFTHNLADKHDTHVAVCLRVIEAIRQMPAGERPKELLGLEVWRDLDWLADSDKKVFDVSAHENLAAALLGVFDSQIAGGKRYDLATLGRRRAHATFFASHGTDTSTQISFGMDLTPLITDDSIDPRQYVAGFISRLSLEVEERINKLT